MGNKMNKISSWPGSDSPSRGRNKRNGKTQISGSNTSSNSRGETKISNNSKSPISAIQRSQPVSQSTIQSEQEHFDTLFVEEIRTVSQGTHSNRLRFSRLVSASGGIDIRNEVKIVEKDEHDTIAPSFVPLTKREPIPCRILVTRMSPSLGEILDKNVDTRFVLIRGQPEYTILFQQTEEKKISFRISSVGSSPKMDKESHSVSFEFSKDSKIYEAEIRFINSYQFNYLTKLLERYIKQKKGTDTYEPKISGLMKNRGTGKEFYGVKAIEWKPNHVRDWLRHIYIKPGRNEEIITVYKYMNQNKILPRAHEFSYLQPKELREYFSNPEDSKNDFLKQLFEAKEGVVSVHREVLIPVMKMAVENVEFNDGYFNFNMYILLTKQVERSPFLDLDIVTSRLVLGKRYMWSVVDCVDHLLSMMFFGVNFDTNVEEDTTVFLEEEKEKDLSNMSKDSSLGKWNNWKDFLEKTNENLGYDLQKVSYEVWVTFLQLELVEEMKRLKEEKKRLDNNNRKNDEDKETKGENENDEGQSALDSLKGDVGKLFEVIKKIELCGKKLVEFEQPSMDEKRRFLNSDQRRLYIQQILFNILTKKVKECGMAEISVKTVLSIQPPIREGMGGETWREEFWSNLQKGAFRVMKGLGRNPDFSKFGFCHASLMFGNLGIHWFGNQVVEIVDRHQRRYEEICAIEAGCPLILTGTVKYVYNNIIKLAEKIVEANVVKTYSFMNFRGKEHTINCQEFVLQLLKSLDFTEYPEEVKLYMDQFIMKYSSMKSGIQRKTRNSRWIPIKKYPEFSKKFREVIEKFSPHDQKDRGERVYFNTHQSVDDFFRECLKIDKDFIMNHFGMYQLLKSFDRAFNILKEAVVGRCPFLLVAMDY